MRGQRAGSVITQYCSQMAFGGSGFEDEQTKTLCKQVPARMQGRRATYRVDVEDVLLEAANELVVAAAGEEEESRSAVHNGVALASKVDGDAVDGDVLQLDGVVDDACGVSHNGCVLQMAVVVLPCMVVLSEPEMPAPAAKGEREGVVVDQLLLQEPVKERHDVAVCLLEAQAPNARVPHGPLEEVSARGNGRKGRIDTHLIALLRAGEAHNILVEVTRPVPLVVCHALHLEEVLRSRRET
jgi:hypothetical protein